jgi:hypothetical protein
VNLASDGSRYAWQVAIFGRKTARQRLRRATRESLTIPAFSSPIDCTPWVVGGLWPAELATITPENAPAAEYLKLDLQRIVESANEELKAIRWAVMPDFARQAAEARVIDVARGFAVRRVESTVRHLHTAAPLSPAEHRRPDEPEAAIVTEDPVGTSREDAQPGRHAASPMAAQEAVEMGRHAGPEAGPEQFGPEATAVVASAEPAAAETPEMPARSAFLDLEAETERLWRLLKFVARQEPGLRWAVGKREDGTTVVVTDMAHGWIPPGISLPAGVRLLEPDRRSGNTAALLGPSALSVSYAPGDPLGWATSSSPTEASPLPRALPMIEDLGWGLTEATHWRDGLPRMVQTLAKAGAAGTGVMEAEVDVLRVHLDTARYQLLAQYPDVDSALLLNCLLLAATEGIATGDELSANYHFAWFQRLKTPPASKWVGQP